MMIKLFLTSSFADTAHLFENFINEPTKGKSVTFIPTASLVEEYRGYVDNDRKALNALGISVEELNISTTPLDLIKSTIEKNHFIYISGGNSFYLLQELKNSGADKLITDEINKGKIYIGASAGSVIMSADIGYIKKMDDREKAKNLNNNKSLNLIDVFPIPHYTNEPFKEIVEEIIVEYKDKLKILPISNSEVIEVIGKKNKNNGREVSRLI